MKNNSLLEIKANGGHKNMALGMSSDCYKIIPKQKLNNFMTRKDAALVTGILLSIALIVIAIVFSFVHILNILAKQ